MKRQEERIKRKEEGKKEHLRDNEGERKIDEGRKAGKWWEGRKNGAA